MTIILDDEGVQGGQHIGREGVEEGSYPRR